MTAPACLVPAVGPPATTLDSYYLGRPAAMTKLDVNSGVSAPLNRGDVAHQLASGGTATTRRRRTRRVYGLNFAALTPDQADPVISYYSGSRGRGPWALIDPTYRNQLTLDASTMYASYGAVIAGAWAPMAGDAAPTIDASVAAPVVGTGLLRWVAVAGHPMLTDGIFSAATLASFAPATTRAVPYLADQRLVLSIYLRAAIPAGTPSATLTAYTSTAAAGATAYATTTTAVLSTTAWTRLSLVIAAGLLPATAEYVHLGVTCPAASTILLAGAQIEYGTAQALPWVTGLGVPRVTISAGMPGSSAVYWRRDHGLTLAEV